MKTVEGNAFMQEMNLQEMNEVNGGFPWGAAEKILVLIAGADALERFIDGWNECGSSRDYI